MSHRTLIDDLIALGFLKTPSIIQAFEAVDRRDFVPEKLARDAYENEPLPIGFGQTISQPLTVAFMLETLAAGKNDTVLDVGCGSGWQTAILAHIVGPSGKIIAVERLAELRKFGQRNVEKYNLDNVRFFTADASHGFEKFAPYDRIIAAAAADELPQAWKQQTRVGGRIVAPIGRSIWQFDHTSENTWSSEEYPGFAFVPLVGGDA